jgi:hypothetical protein
MKFNAKTPDEARALQKKARQKLFELMMGGGKPKRSPLNPKLIKREESPDGDYSLEEMELSSLPDRRVHLWVARPKRMPENGLPAVLALHGHGGSGEGVVRGEGIYWYGKALVQRGYLVVAPDIGQHELQHEDWTLMGERTWDSLICLDYLCSLKEVNGEKIGTVGLSLGGETVMYVAALDERIKIAVSSGWLTTISNMKRGHCPCWNFPGLEENFEFSDIFACLAPRHLVLEIGRKEKAPGGFPVEIAERAFEEIRRAYRVFGAEERCILDVHDGGHVFHGKVAFEWIDRIIGP